MVRVDTKHSFCVFSSAVNCLSLNRNKENLTVCPDLQLVSKGRKMLSLAMEFGSFFAGTICVMGQSSVVWYSSWAVASVNWDPSIGIRFFLLGLEQKHILIVAYYRWGESPPWNCKWSQGSGQSSEEIRTAEGDGSGKVLAWDGP